MNNRTKGQCTCPSGDGSLRWPCPVHPPSGKLIGNEVLEWLLADGDRCASVVADAYDAWDTETSWERVLIAEIEWRRSTTHG